MYSSDVSFQKRTRRTLRVRAPSGLPRHRWGLAPFCFWAQTSFPSYCPLYLLMVSSQTFCDQGDSGGASKFRSIEENVPPHRRVSGTNLRLPILVSELANFRLAAETAQQKILLPPFVQMGSQVPFFCLHARTWAVPSESCWCPYILCGWSICIAPRYRLLVRYSQSLDRNGIEEPVKRQLRP
jgi:hypothetical protein